MRSRPLSTFFGSLRAQGGPTDRALTSNERVALLGLVAAGVTLAFSVWLLNVARFARDVRLPASVATTRLRSGLERSVGLLTTGMAMGDVSLTARERRMAWEEEIIPSIDRIQQVVAQTDDQAAVDSVAQARAHLKAFQVLQFEIESLARAPGAVPAEVSYRTMFVPVHDTATDTLLGLWVEASERLPVPQFRLLAELQTSLAELDASMVRLLADASPGALWGLQQTLEETERQREALGEGLGSIRHESLRDGLGRLLVDVDAALKVAERVHILRSREDWNLALSKADDELLPLLADLRARIEHGERVQVEHAIESMQGIGRFGGVVVLLSIGMGLTSLVSLYTSFRASHRMRELLERAQMLGQYAVEARLGGGAMGDVFKARHALLRRETAVKVIKASSAADDQAQERFKQEVQLTSSLTHPNTVQVFDYGRTPDGLFYYAMELLDGVDLQTLVDELGPLPPGRVVSILRQACGSLAEAHHRRLLHRDLKPSNLMLTRRGLDHDVVKVLDFGLAKQVTDEREHEVVGTPLYMSPEALSAGDYSPRSDLYGLGCVAYFLLTGTPPYVAASVEELERVQQDGPPPKPSDRVGQELPESLEAVVMACLEVTPSDRPGSAEELDRLLEECALDGWREVEARAWWEDHAEIVAAWTQPNRPLGSGTRIDIQRSTSA